jgi:hypothetical protein
MGRRLNPCSRATDWPSWRDALRLQLWRAIGNTGAWLSPDQAAQKRAACG